MNVGLAVVVALLLVGCRSSEDAAAWQAGPSLALPLAAGADALQSRQAQDADAERAIAALADQQRALTVVKAELRRRLSAPSLARFSGLQSSSSSLTCAGKPDAGCRGSSSLGSVSHCRFTQRGR